ncbi:ABC transporter ATP-binding protein [Ruminiclostridium josui]|uniref:ABC transporter ATP-binding protein n=1 Tax=Ruminiclostridium josui TaxID=1499 RepID=UPI00046425C1|nr:ABC transporter ATP-binding protein [Ruminiclostridium josui]
MSFLKTNNLAKSYTRRGEEFFAVDRVDIELYKTDFAVITGHSGSGKSTLLSLLTGILKPDSGEIIFDGKDLTQLSEDKLAYLRCSEIGYIPQGNTLLYNLSVIENITLPSKLSGIKGVNIVELLKKVGISHLLNERPRNLSGGEARRVAIARSLISNPKILIADEPTSDLDPENADSILRLFEEINKGGTAIIIVTHDRQIPTAANRYFMMQNGKIIEN